MSRAIIIENEQREVEAVCEKLGVPISVIETLPQGYTRLVLKTGDDAAVLRRRFKDRLIEEPVKRTPLSVATQSTITLHTASPPRIARSSNLLIR